MTVPNARPLPPLSFSAWLRWDVVQRLLPPDTRSILEIGAGGGSMGSLLARRWEYVGLEPDPTSFAIAVERIGASGDVIAATAEEFSPGQVFDVVCAFEVLEHVEDDLGALRSWLRHLRPGGTFLASVPFGRRHFGAWDAKAGHYRRYDRGDLASLLLNACLVDPVTVAYGFPLGSTASFVRDRIARRERTESTMAERTAGSARNLQPPPWAAGATRVVSAPFRFVQRPFGNTRLGPGLVGRGRLREGPG